MKVKFSIWKKLKICLTFFKDGNFENGLIEQCPNCKSVNISNIQWNEEIYEKGSEYHAVYKCDKCGAEATIMEDWYYV